MRANGIRHLIGLAVLVLLVGCTNPDAYSPPQQVTVEHYEKQTRSKEVYSAYIDSRGRLVMHGSYINYYANGKKYIEANYEHGKLQGQFKLYSIDGASADVGTYRQGKPWDGLLQRGHSMVRYSNGVAIGVVTNGTVR